VVFHCSSPLSFHRHVASLPSLRLCLSCCWSLRLKCLYKLLW
jgi:hypothetical protein